MRHVHPYSKGETELDVKSGAGHYHGLGAGGMTSIDADTPNHVHTTPDGETTGTQLAMASLNDATFKVIASMFGHEVADAMLAFGDKDPGAAVRNRPDPVFSSTHPKVKDDKDHFPIDTIGRARNALARVAQYDFAPIWWGGSLSELKYAVSRAVKAKYPSIEVSD